MQPVRVASSDDHVGSLVARASGRLEPDAGTAANHDHGLSGKVQLAAHDAVAFRTGSGQPWWNARVREGAADRSVVLVAAPSGLRQE